MIQAVTGLPLQKAFFDALTAHKAGDLVRAGRGYRLVLKRAPRHFDSLRLLGLVEHQCGRQEQALRFVRQALDVDPMSAEALADCGLILSALNQCESALASYDRAAAIRPTYVEALTNRAAVLREMGLLAEALSSLDKALSVRSDYAVALYNQGMILCDVGRYDASLMSLNKLLAVCPDHAEALNKRGHALLCLQHFGEALANLDRALIIVPRLPEALEARGNLLRQLGRHSDALESYDRSLAINPSYSNGLTNRGNGLFEINRYEEALTNYNRALQITPQSPEILYNRGNALVGLRRYREALSDYNDVLLVKHDHLDAICNRATLLAELKQYQEAANEYQRLIALKPDYDYALGSMLHCRMHCCDWQSWDEIKRSIVDGLRRGERRVSPFVFGAVSDSAADQLLASQIWMRDKCPPAPEPIRHPTHYRHDRIRLAYVSADFCDHPMSRLLVDLIERHDKKRFEVTAISFAPDSLSPLKARIKAGFERFIDVRWSSDKDVAKLLTRSETDIAIDLMGFTRGGRPGIFTLRPAPIQVNYLGYAGTMAASYIDYILADEHVIPLSDKLHFVENVVYLPDCHQPNDPALEISERTPSRAEVGLPEKGFVFCCFNNSYKITPWMFDVWMRLLAQTEGSVLWLFKANHAVERHLQRAAEERGVESCRLVFAPHAKLPDHLARHRLADLFLDTLPYNAHTTANDSLWAGLPILTCPGASFGSRVASSLLIAVGLPELIAGSLEEYEAIALSLTRNPALLSALRMRLSENRLTFPLFNAERFCHHVEAAYVTMWERNQRGETPTSFAVEAAKER
jgi:protein O-GlcNAc transferase